jgi:hypothetical protein
MQNRHEDKMERAGHLVKYVKGCACKAPAVVSPGSSRAAVIAGTQGKGFGYAAEMGRSQYVICNSCRTPWAEQR